MANTKIPSELIADNSITSSKIDSTSTGITFADLIVDTDTLVVDSVNDRVGIGTNNPTGAKLQVQADGIAIKLDGTADTTRTLFFRNTTSNNPAQIYSDGSLRLRTEDASTNITFHTNSTGTDNERMRIDSSGRVMINTTTPTNFQGDSSKLGIYDSTRATLSIQAGGYTNAQTAEIFFSGGVGDGGTRTEGWYIRGAGTGTGGNVQTVLDIIQSRADTDIVAARFDESGNVGIGTSSPNANAKLDVNGVIRLYNASSNPTAVAGGLYYNTTDGQVKVSNGTAWYPVGASVLPTAVSNLYSWWDFSGTYSTIGSGNSTVSDASGNGYTLTESGTVTTENFPSGKSGMRTGASGAANYFTSNAIPATSGARTLFAIIYNLTNTGVTYQHIMHYGSTNAYQAFALAYKSTGVLTQHIWVGDGTTVSYTVGRTGLAGVAVIFSTYDGSSVGRFRVYDAGGTIGVTTSSTIGSITAGTAYGMHVGARISGSEYGDVVIGECGAYSKELSESEMDTIATGLLARWT